MRQKPLLPPDPCNAEESWTDISRGIALPVCHCAFTGCTWTSNRSPCGNRRQKTSVWVGFDGVWEKHAPSASISNGVVACCGDPTCLREHLAQVHAKEFLCLQHFDAKDADVYSYYLEAIAERERQAMPSLGSSIDRRTFHVLKEDFCEDSVQALVCMCCARIATCTNHNTAIGYINAHAYFK